MSEERRSADSLDPAVYQEHTLRTAVLLAEMAKDLAGVRKTLESLALDHALTFRNVSDLQRELAVFKEASASKIEGLSKAGAKVEEGLQFTRRTLFASIASAVIAFLFRFLAK